MTINEMKELALHAAKGTAPTNYSVDQVDAALLDGFKDMAGSLNAFMKNRYDIYEIISETADEIVPAKVIDAFGMFAEVRQVAQNEKVTFKRKIGRNRAKKFLTQVGLSGVYETFRLDSETFEIGVHAIGGAGTVDFERVLDGAESMVEVMQIVTEGLVDSLYIEVQRALIAVAELTDETMPAANRVTGSFDGDEMFALVNTVKAYGDDAVIFAAPEFVAAMGPDAIVPVPTSGNYGGVYHPQDIDAIHNQGYINIFRGTPIVQFKQSYFDENNTEVVINPQFAYVLPTGKEKIVKIVMEGNTQVYDFTNRDQSMEIHTYKKVGVGILTYNNWGIYKNTDIHVNDDDANAIKWNDNFYGI